MESSQSVRPQGSGLSVAQRQPPPWVAVSLLAGYEAVRRLTQGHVRKLGNFKGAFITDFVADSPDAVRALARRAVDIAADMRAAIALVATMIPAHARAFARLGFISETWPLIGNFLKRRAPQFMWAPHGPAAQLSARDMMFTFADATIDFDL